MAKELTQKEKDYVRYRAEGFPKSRCAELAGYSTPTVSYAALERRESIKTAIYSASMDMIGKELLPKAIRVFGEILDEDSTASDGIKLKAAAFVTDKAIELQNMASAGDIANKNPLDMTAAELEIFVMRGRIVLGRERAKIDLGIIDHDAENEE